MDPNRGSAPNHTTCTPSLAEVALMGYNHNYMGFEFYKCFEDAWMTFLMLSFLMFTPPVDGMN